MLWWHREHILALHLKFSGVELIKGRKRIKQKLKELGLAGVFVTGGPAQNV